MRWVCIILLAGTVGCADMSPYFTSVLAPVDTYDTVGPYVVDAMVAAPAGVGLLRLRVTDETGLQRFGDIDFTQDSGDAFSGRWIAELPGIPAGSGYSYYLWLEDVDGVRAYYPEDAPDSLLMFMVHAP